MAGARKEKVNSLIKQEISKILLREFDFAKGSLVTVTRAEVAPDLGTAKVYIAVIPESKADGILKVLNRQIYQVQQKFNRRLKMKIVPQIRFIKELETQRAAEVEGLLVRIKETDS